MVSATRACAPTSTVSSVSASFFPSDQCLSCFFSSPRRARFLSLALSSLSLFLVFFRYRVLSLSGAPRLQVRRARAPVLGIRKSLICESFRYLPVNFEETKNFGPSRDVLNTLSFDDQYFSRHHFVRSIDFYCFLGGRRKLPQAGEVRRLLGPAW